MLSASGPGVSVACSGLVVVLRLRVSVVADVVQERVAGLQCTGNVEVGAPGVPDWATLPGEHHLSRTRLSGWG